MTVRLEKNQLVRAVIEGYTSQGLGVTHVEGRAVFVQGAARGDACLLRLLKAPATGPLYAKIEKMETPSQARQAIDCAAAGRCGGCDFRHLDYGEELSLKQDRVRDALARIAGIDLNPAPILPAPEINGYRNKALFPVRLVDGKPATGFFRSRSHELVPIDNCLLQNEKANACAKALRTWMARFGIPAYDETTGEGLIRHLLIRTGAATGQALCCVSATRPTMPHAPALITALREACPGLVGVVQDVNTRRDNVALSGHQRILWGQDRLEDNLCSLRFSLTYTSFFQVNPTQAEQLYKLAAEMSHLSGRENVCELYCGAGSLTLTLARLARRVVGVDIAERAVADARDNARNNAITNAEFRCADAGEAAEALRNEGNRPDLLLVDPPRKGLDEPVIRAISRIAPPRMIYISCDPATLARDLRRLREDTGLRTIRCAPVDMFPRTANVECVAELVR